MFVIRATVSVSITTAAAAYVQTPADIIAQAQAVQDQAAENSFSIYQLKGGNETLDYRFEPLDSIHRNGLSVKPENYELVYTAPLTAKDDLESIYTRFNVDRPADFTGHSLSVSDIVVLHQDGKDTAHYCDRVGFSEVPEFLQERQPAVQPALQGMYPSLQAELPGGGVGVPTLPVPAREKRRG